MLRILSAVFLFGLAQLLYTKSTQNSKYLILDVRSPKEYLKGHVCNSINIPTSLPPLKGQDVDKLKENLRRLTESLGPNTPIIVYCKKGIRASRAAKILKDLGMKNVCNLGGVEKGTLSSLIKKNKIKLC